MSYCPFYQTHSHNPVHLFNSITTLTSSPPCHVSNSLLTLICWFPLSVSQFFCSLCLLFHWIFSPSVHRRWHDIMVPYNLLYAILPQVWLLHGAGLGQWKRQCQLTPSFPWLSMVILGLSCSETWWCPGPIWVKKGEICYFLATGGPGPNALPVMIGNNN